MAKIIVTSVNEEMRHLVDTNSKFEGYDYYTKIIQPDGDVIKVRESLEEICNLIYEAEKEQNSFSKEPKNCLSAYECAKFIVQMYYQSPIKYYLSRIKLERLLVIVGMRYMVNTGKNLFDRSIMVYSSGGVGLNVYKEFFSSIVEGQEMETNKPLPTSIENVRKTLTDAPKFPCGYEFKMYGKEQELFNQVRDWFIEAFIQFGDCETILLGKAIDRFKNEITCDSIRTSSRPSIIKTISASKLYEYFDDISIIIQNGDASKLTEETELNLDIELKTTEEIEVAKRIMDILKKENERACKVVDTIYREIINFVAKK